MQQKLQIEFGMSEKTLQSYLIGFTLSLVLTVISFYIVAFKPSATSFSICVVLSALAIAQLIIQTVYFLGLNKSRQGQWNLLPFAFTILVVTIVAGGSLWIMYNLNYNMVN